MTTILSAAASGMLHNQLVLDTVAHNVANANTDGFKRVRPLAQGEPLPGDITEGKLGVALTTLDRVFAPGPLRPADDPLAFAILDDALLTVRLPGGGTAYTRVGYLRVDAAGNVVTPSGYLLDPPVTVPPGFTSVAIDATGTIAALSPTGAEEELGRVTLARFPNPQGLRALGEGLFAPTANSGEPVLGFPGEAGFAELSPGMVEASNVELASELTTLLIAQRAYQACARAFRVGDEMIAIATKLTQ